MDRRVPDIDPPEKYKFKDRYSWRVFARILSDSEMENVDLFAEKFGKKLAKAFNDNVSTKWTYPKPTQFAGVKNKGPDGIIKYLPDYFMPDSVVLYCKFCFEKAIESGDLFKDSELMAALFPGVEKPELFFENGI